MTGRTARVIPIDGRVSARLKANVGMAVFLGSWGINFLGLFVAYVILWSRNAVWPPVGTPPLPCSSPLFNTAVAIGSSYAYERAVRAARENRPTLVMGRLSIAAVLGAVFLAMQVIMWNRLRAGGFVFGLNNFVGMFYMLTLFHAAHVAAGLLVLAYVMWRASRVPFTPVNDTLLRLSAWFWHFVTIAWVGVFLMLWVL